MRHLDFPPALVLRLLDEPDETGEPRRLAVHRDRLVIGRGGSRGYDLVLPPSSGIRGCFHVVREGTRYRLEIAAPGVPARIGATAVHGDIDLLDGDVVTFGPENAPYRVRFSPGEADGGGSARPPRRARPVLDLRESAAKRVASGSLRGRLAHLRRRLAPAWPRDLARLALALLGFGVALPLGLTAHRARREVAELRQELDAVRSQRERWRAAALAPAKPRTSPLEERLVGWIRSPALADDPWYEPDPVFLAAVSRHFVQARDSSWFRWLVRSGRGADLLRIAEPSFEDLPEVFRWHALVESAACPFAISTAGARGPWQLTWGTATTLGLPVPLPYRGPEWVHGERQRAAGGGGAADYAACDMAAYARASGRAEPPPGTPWHQVVVDPADARTDVERSTAAAAQYHRRLWGRAEIAALPDRAERIWMVLAGWNCGPEHIADGLDQLAGAGLRRSFANLWTRDGRGEVRVRCDAEETLEHVPRVVAWYLAGKVSRGDLEEAGP